MLMNINYKSLDSEVTDGEIKSFKPSSSLIVSGAEFVSVGDSKLIAKTFFGCIAVILLFNFFVSDIDAVTRTQIITYIIVAFFIAMFVIIFRLYRKAHIDNIKKHIILARFAGDNNMTLVPSKGDLSGMSGVMFNIGRDRTLYNQINGIYDNKVFEIASYRFITGSGKSQRTVDGAYIMIKLDRNLPHMVLDARSNNLNVYKLSISNLPAIFNEDQKLSLEGDFDSHFTLYAPSDYKRDALYVFTPDLMALFIDETCDYDAEIIDDVLYIYSDNPFNLTNKIQLKRIFKIIDTVGTKAVSQTDQYSDERTGDLTDKIVAEGGRRLKVRNLTWISASIGIIMLIFQSIIMYRSFR